MLCSADTSLKKTRFACPELAIPIETVTRAYTGLNVAGTGCYTNVGYVFQLAADVQTYLLCGTFMLLSSSLPALLQSPSGGRSQSNGEKTPSKAYWELLKPARLKPSPYSHTIWLSYRSVNFTETFYNNNIKFVRVWNERKYLSFLLVTSSASTAAGVWVGGQWHLST